MILYDYFRSSAAYRVRIALALKGLVVERRPVHLLEGKHREPAYRTKNPLALVPTLELDDGALITQSLAIIDYLETLKPKPPLLPADPVLAAKVRAAALTIACDIHPLTNLRVIKALEESFGAGPREIDEWRSRWIIDGLAALDALIAPAPFSFGAEPSLADVLPYSAALQRAPLRHPISTGYPNILGVEAACREHPAFVAAHPDTQPASWTTSLAFCKSSITAARNRPASPPVTTR